MKPLKPVKIPASTPRNPLAVQGRLKTGAGKHKDKKRQDKQQHKE